MTLIAKERNIGAWIFLVGVIFSVIVGVLITFLPIPSLAAYNAKIYGLLVLLGIIVGIFIKVGERDNIVFLVASAILVIVSKFGMDSVKSSLIGIGIGDGVSLIFGALLALFVPATIIVALKTIFSVAKV